MATTATMDLQGYERYTYEGEIIEALLLSTVMAFWLSTVNNFEVLYEAAFEIFILGQVNPYLFHPMHNSMLSFPFGFHKNSSVHYH